MTYKWKNWNKARIWIFEEFGKEVKGKSLSSAKRKKIFSRLKDIAEKKDARGEF